MIPLIVLKCMVAAKMNWSTINPGLSFGNIGGCGGQVPGLVTIFEFTAIFCIEPGAGINGIGNGLICAPVQYALTPLPNSLTNENG